MASSKTEQDLQAAHLEIKKLEAQLRLEHDLMSEQQHIARTDYERALARAKNFAHEQAIHLTTISVALSHAEPKIATCREAIQNMIDDANKFTELLTYEFSTDRFISETAVPKVMNCFAKPVETPISGSGEGKYTVSRDGAFLGYALGDSYEKALSAAIDKYGCGISIVFSHYVVANSQA